MTDHRDLKDRILGAVPIDSYIGRYVTLKKQGRYFKGLCPFHNEKTPSFTVTPEKGLFHCFGCGAGGDLFKFVMDIEGLTFPEAVESLARYAGIEVDENRTKSDQRKRLESLNELVQRKFQEFFQTPAAHPFQNYLQKRGLKPESWKRFGIGASPDEWRWLTVVFPDKHPDLKLLGLIRESKGNTYDFFRGRILFPIQDGSGRVVGFGGRALPGKDQEAKYLNSTDSEIFHKGRVLYGLYQAMEEMRKSRTAVLVEGYLDVIGLHEAGIGNVLAPLGTALTADHVNLLRRYVDRVVFLLDGDRAGRAAALKSARMVLEIGGLEATVVLLPEGMDPFDISRLYPSGGMEHLLKDGITAERFVLVETLFPERSQLLPLKGEGIEAIVGFVNGATRLFRHSISEMELNLSEKRSALLRLREMVSGFQRASDRELFLSEGGRILGLSMEALNQEFRELDRKKMNQPPPGLPQQTHFSGKQSRIVPGDPRIGSERRMLMELIHHPHLFAMFHARISEFDFQDEHSAMLWRILETRYYNGEVWSPELIASTGIPAETLQEFAPVFLEKEAESRYGEDPDGAAEAILIIEDILLDHRIRGLRHSLEKVRSDLRLASGPVYERLIQDYQKMVVELKTLESEKSGEKPGKKSEN